jgi:hypothetical protein
MVGALRDLLTDVGVDEVRELVGPSWPELARLLPALGEPASGPPGESAQARLFELLLGLLGRLGEQAPLVLVVEDLHWADRSTRDTSPAAISHPPLAASSARPWTTPTSHRPSPDS